MSWNTIPVLNGAIWSGNAQVATTKQLLSSVSGLYDDIQDFEFSTISIADLKVSTLTAKEWISAPILYVSSVVGENIYTSTLQVSSMTIPGATITQNGIFISTGDFSAVSLSTLRFSALGDSNSLFGDFDIDLGLGSFLGGLVGNLGGLLGGTIGAITGTIGMATGIAGMTMPRTVNNITPGKFETINGTTQLQISTLGDEYPFYSTIFRLTSTTTFYSSGGVEVPLGVETFVSTIFPAGTKCVRSVGDPLNLPACPTSTIQAFGQWTPLLNDDYNLKFSTITTSTLTALDYVTADHFYQSGYGVNGLNAGIGTFTPLNIQTTLASGTGVGFIQASPYMSTGLFAGISRIAYNFSNYSTCSIGFQPNNGASAVESMTVTSSNIGIQCNAPQYTLDVNGDTNIHGDVYISGQIFGSNLSTIVIPSIVTDRIVLSNSVISTTTTFNDIDIITEFYKPSTFLSSMGWNYASNIANPFFINQTNIGSYFSTLLLGASNQSTFLLTANYPNSTFIDYYQSTGSGIFRYYQNGNASFVDLALTTPQSNRFTFNFLSNSWYDSGPVPTPPYGFERFPVSSIVGSAKMKINTGKDYNDIFSDKPLYFSTSGVFMEQLRPYQYLSFVSTHKAEKIESEFYNVSTLNSTIGFKKVYITSNALESVNNTNENNFVSTLIVYSSPTTNLGLNTVVNLGTIDVEILPGNTGLIQWYPNITGSPLGSSTFGSGTHRFTNPGFTITTGWSSAGPTPSPPYGTIVFPNVYVPAGTTELDFYNTVSSSLISTNQNLVIQAPFINLLGSTITSNLQTHTFFTSSISTAYESFYLASTFQTFNFSSITLLSSLQKSYNIPGRQKDRQLSFGFNVASNNITPGGGSVYGTPFNNPYPNNLVFFVCNFGFGNFTTACDITFQLEADGTTIVNESLSENVVPPTLGNITRILQFDGGNVGGGITKTSPISPVLTVSRQLTGNEIVTLNGITFFV